VAYTQCSRHSPVLNRATLDMTRLNEKRETKRICQWKALRERGGAWNSLCMGWWSIWDNSYNRTRFNWRTEGGGHNTFECCPHRLGLIIILR
jgi:hypothetical protein